MPPLYILIIEGRRKSITNFIMKGGVNRILQRAVANHLVSFYPNKRKIELLLKCQEAAYRKSYAGVVFQSKNWSKSPMMPMIAR